jgi:hypothetical protein
MTKTEEHISCLDFNVCKRKIFWCLRYNLELGNPINYNLLCVVIVQTYKNAGGGVEGYQLKN